jgi:hypothetical protein
MALSHKQLVEKLNQRLSGVASDDAKVTGADEVEEIENEDAYPVDFGPLERSLNSVFGKDAFLYPPKENNEILCVYFDPEVYKIKADEFKLERLQDWCIDKGFSIVSKMGGSRAMKVYFTPIREPDEKGKEGEKGEKFSKTNFGKAPANANE